VNDANPEGADHYLSAVDGPEIETRVKGSRFLAQVFRAPSEELAAELLSALSRKYYDATHHCSGARYGMPDAVLERFDDDGEPSGTAGRPILGALRRLKLFDGLIVVTRYFGGTKLGSGGLVRAYGEAAAAAAAAVEPELTWITSELLCRFQYEDLGSVESELTRRTAELRGIQRDFCPEPRFRIRVLATRAATLRAALVETTAGRIEFES
jgi:uncharacterized YigZ family protein